MSLSTNEIREILGILEESEWDEARVQIGDVTLSVSRNGSPSSIGEPQAVPAASVPPSAPATGVPAETPSPAAAPSPSAPAVASPTNSSVIFSPSVGVFWRSPEPGAPPFVEVGSRVDAGDMLCIVEVMKLMNQVVTDVAGVVSEIQVENGEQVEFETTLFIIDPAA